MDESLAQSLRSFESEPEELFAAHSMFPSRKALWDGLFSTKQSARDPQKPWGFVAKLLKWPVTSTKVKATPPMLTKSLTKRTLARRSLEIDRGHGDLLIVRCVAPPGTLQEYANFAHSNLQMPSANTLPKCTVLCGHRPVSLETPGFGPNAATTSERYTLHHRESSTSN